MSTYSDQLELLPRRALNLSVETQEEIARTCRDKHEAQVKCFLNSGLEPKQVYGPLKKSQTWFSQFQSGNAYLDPRLELKFMELCGNLIPLRFDAWKTGHELKPLITGLEAQLEAERRRADEAEQRQRYLEELLMGRRQK